MDQPDQLTLICCACKRESMLVNELGYCPQCWGRLAGDAPAGAESEAARAARRYIREELQQLVGSLEEYPALADAAVRDRRIVEELERAMSAPQLKAISCWDADLRRNADDEDEE